MLTYNAFYQKPVAVLSSRGELIAAIKINYWHAKKPHIVIEVSLYIYTIFVSFYENRHAQDFKGVQLFLNTPNKQNKKIIESLIR